MAFLTGGANSAAATGFDVANSCRWNDGDEPYMHKTLVSPTSATISTISFWTKVSMNDTNVAKGIFGSRTDTNNRHNIWIAEDTTPVSALAVWGKTSGSTDINFSTSMAFKDPNAWYHVVVAIDTTQGTEGNRVKIYVNGTRITSFGTETYPDQNAVMQWSVADAVCQVGAYSVAGGIDYEWDGYLAEFVFIDGTQYAASDFGEFDEDSPTIWKPKDVSGLTFGNNGFYLDFEASDNLGNDANGGTDLTEVNLAAADSATDVPTNNFATLNALEYSGGGKTFSEGNCKQFLTGVANFTRSTIGVASGKWYCEVKLIAGLRAMYGISSYLSNAASNYLGELGNTTVGYSYGIIGNTGRLYHAGGSTANWINTVAADDIVMIAVDLDNYKIYFGINGTWERSGDPTSGATGTGAYTIVAPSLNGTGFYHFAFGCNSTSEDNNSEMNFGGCSGFAVSSANQDADGYGNFEYAVPSGYFSLCSKNLAEYG